MRLIRTTSTGPELVYFANEQQLPAYAILSHVWGEEEVTFQHMQDPSSAKDMKGWTKIVRSCELACSDGWQYIWIDTCCIDKSSSSELTEAINSMYRYYGEAMVCYAYLADMQGPANSSCDPDLEYNASIRFNFADTFRQCKWFTRGWTLQELIAPTTVVFFGKDWEKIGTKASLQGTITEITGIPSAVLLNNNLSETSIACRMSWAARRETTRLEDRAYSLLGIFGVFMSPIYGEGEHAFIRLQEEILKVSDDHTIFAWEPQRMPPLGMEEIGLFATSPDDFGRSGEYERSDRPNSQRPYSMTNMGLLIHLSLIPIRYGPHAPVNRYFRALLNCCRRGTSRHVAIEVRRSKGLDGYHYARSPLPLSEYDLTLAQLKKIPKPQELLFRTHAHVKDDNPNGSHFMTVSFGQDIRVEQKYPPYTSIYTDSQDFFSLENGKSYVLLCIHAPSNRLFVVVTGIHRGRVWLDLILNFETGKPNLEDIHQSYYQNNGRGEILSENLDMVSKNLTDNKAILVEARPRYQNNQGSYSDGPGYVVNIRLIDRLNPDEVPLALPIPTCEYAFSVHFPEVMEAGFSRPTVYPNKSWGLAQWVNYSIVDLFVNDRNVLGILLFHHQTNGQRFAVMLGVRDRMLLSDVLVLRDAQYEETAKDIYDSYFDNRRQSQIQQLHGLIKQDSDEPILTASGILRPLESSSVEDSGLAISICSSVMGKSRKDFKSEIKVRPLVGRSYRSYL